MKYGNPPTVPDINYSPGNRLCIFLKKPKSVILIILYPTKNFEVPKQQLKAFFRFCSIRALTAQNGLQMLKNMNWEAVARGLKNSGAE